MKGIESVLTIICIALVADMWYVAMTPLKTVTVIGTLMGYTMLSAVIILGLVLNVPLDRKLVQLITLPGAVMYFASGCLMLEAWRYVSSRADNLLTAGILALANGFIHLVEFVLTYYRQRLPSMR